MDPSTYAAAVVPPLLVGVIAGSLRMWSDIQRLNQAEVRRQTEDQRRDEQDRHRDEMLAQTANDVSWIKAKLQNGTPKP